ncbi:hypothetical protein AG4045_016014 [Apium graveolens]|uniref:Uncharacterized protein n=1 Tax=Apium graveolens TaxID=4045 RepID=A0A6L5BDE4_APIGR|nr:hypothetical protein AG4045_016014 [Apium graveolens]
MVGYHSNIQHGSTWNKRETIGAAMSMKEPETLVPDPSSNQEPSRHHNSQSENEVEEEVSAGELKSLPSSSEIIKAIEVTGCSVDHLECFNDAAGRLQECSKCSYSKSCSVIYILYNYTSCHDMVC